MLSKKIEQKLIQVEKILIHNASLAELEHQANQNKSKGLLGLNEIKNLRKLGEKYNFDLQFIGKRPSGSDIRYARLGEIDASIRDAAYEEDATLVTADKVQSNVAEAKGIKLLFFEMEKGTKTICGWLMAALAVPLMLSGCAAEPLEKTGFLSDYSHLQKESKTSLRYVNQKKLGKYDKFIVDKFH